MCVETKPKILIVEDDASQRLLYSEELKEEGYEPITAKNGKEAMQILKKIKPDLIVLDIIMPVMDGMEALGRIIGRHKDIPIILYSSYPHYKDDFMSWMADAYLTKSSDLTELKETIRNLLKKKRKGVKPLREEVGQNENVKRKKT
jgi:two-component system response regulator (stage 0 sporulation protein F)